MAKAERRETITEGSGNVFADLGFENPEEELAKSCLVSAISKVIEAKGLTQVKVAELIGIDQPQVSKLLRGRTEGYSTDRLIRILNQLGQDVEIRISEKPTDVNRAGHFIVSNGSKGNAVASKHSTTGQFVSESGKSYDTNVVKRKK